MFSLFKYRAFQGIRLTNILVVDPFCKKTLQWTHNNGTWILPSRSIHIPLPDFPVTYFPVLFWDPVPSIDQLVVVLQLLSCVWLFVECRCVWCMDCSTPGFPFFHCLPEFAQTHVHRVSDAIQPLILYRSLLLLPSIFPSIRVFPN